MIRVALPVLATLALAPQDPPRPDDPPADEKPQRTAEGEEEDLYPPWASDALVSFYLVKGDLDEERLGTALSDLDESTFLLEGPRSHPSRPKSGWIAVEQAAHVQERDLLRAVQKGRAKVEEVRWTTVSWTPQKPPSSKKTGGDLVKQILNLHGDMAWVDNKGSFLTFFYKGKKLDGEELVERFGKLWSDQARDPADLELEIVSDSIAWPLLGEVDAKAARKAEKEIAKLEGVVEVRVDPERRTLEMSVLLDGLTHSGPPGEIRGGGVGTGMRYVFDTNQVWAILTEHGIDVDDA